MTALITENVQVRPATLADADAATILFNACSQAIIGGPEFAPGDLANEWASPDFDVAGQTRAIFTPDGQMVAYIEVWNPPPHVKPWLWGRVHPDYHGLGYGTALLRWAEAKARSQVDLAPAGTMVTANAGSWARQPDALALFENEGFQLVRHFWRMKIDMDDAPPAPQWPAGITVRMFDPAQDSEAVFRAVEDSFSDHWGHVPRSFEEAFAQWQHRLATMPHFDPALWFLAMDGDEIAGFSLCRPRRTEYPDIGWIGSLGVRRPWRRRGLGLALLQHSFGAFYQRGIKKAALGVDASSLTGATRLYEKAGMYVFEQSSVYQKVLRPGADLTTQIVESS